MTFKDIAAAEKTVQNCLREGVQGIGDKQHTGMDQVLKDIYSQFGENGFSKVMQDTMRYQNEHPALKGHFSVQDGAYNDGKLSPNEIMYSNQKEAVTTWFKFENTVKREVNGSETVLEGTARRQHEENPLFRKLYDLYHSFGS